MFKKYDQKQTFLLPLSLDEFVPAEHPARTVNDVVDNLDLSFFLEKYRVMGASSYDPGMMLKVFFYAYSMGITSSRDIANCLDSDTVFMFLSGMQHPDHRTLCRYRVRHRSGIEKAFKEIVQFCLGMGMIGFGNVSFDGTKIKANASGKKTKDRDALDKSIKKWMDESEKIDRQEDGLYGEDETPYRMPPHLRDPVERKKLIREKVKELEDARKRLEESGEKTTNLTDPDANLMKFKTGVMPGYNGQTAVEGKNQVIIAAQLVRDGSDVKQLVPMEEIVFLNTGRNPVISTGDSGYFSLDNMQYLKDNHLFALIPDTMYQLEKLDKMKYYPRTRFVYDEKTDTYTCPGGKTMTHHGSSMYNGDRLESYRCKETECKECLKRAKCTGGLQRTLSRNERDPLRQEMRDRLDTPLGTSIYKERMSTVEPVYGDIKENMGFRQFRLRGLEKTSIEFNLICIAHNIKKIHEYLQQKRRQLTDPIKNTIQEETGKAVSSRSTKAQSTVC